MELIKRRGTTLGQWFPKFVGTVEYPGRISKYSDASPSQRLGCTVPEFWNFHKTLKWFYCASKFKDHCLEEYVELEEKRTEERSGQSIGKGRWDCKGESGNFKGEGNWGRVISWEREKRQARDKDNHKEYKNRQVTTGFDHWKDLSGLASSKMMGSRSWWVLKWMVNEKVEMISNKHPFKGRTGDLIYQDFSRRGKIDLLSHSPKHC